MVRKWFRQVLGAALIATGFMAGGLVDAQPVSQTPKQTIFDYKAELSLTDEQEKEIRRILAELNREMQISQAKRTLLKFELEDLIQKEDELEVIRTKLQEQADLLASARFTDHVATRNINNVLSAPQLAKWRGIQAAARATR